MPAALEAPTRSRPETQEEKDHAPRIPTEHLPMHALRDSFKAGLRESDQVLLIGATGSGKTILGSLYMLEEFQTRNPNARILVTQPRRRAVDSVANSIASCMEEERRGIVGYRYKGRNTITDETKIALMVDGSLVNELARNPTLYDDEYGEWDAVLVDEAHKGSADMLFELAELKRAQALRKEQGKPPLTIVVATGTGNVEDFKAYMPRLVVREALGRSNPLTHRYLDHEVEPEEIVDAAVDIFDEVLRVSPTGDKIIFMPGNSHIDEAIDKLKIKYKGRVGISFYKVTGGDQDKGQNVNLNAKATPGTIRVFVGTNVMQEAITIPGATDSIMSGFKKEKVYDPKTGLSSLRLVKATQNDMIQQGGRSARDVAGNAWYLMTKGQFDGRPVSAPKSEIEQTDVTELVFKILARKRDPYTFDFMTKPPKEHIDAAIAVLRKLGAVDKAGNVTQEVGGPMATLPFVDPHYARMLIEAKKRSCVEPVAVLVGFLSAGKSVFALKRNEDFAKKYAVYIHPASSDYLTLLNVWNAYVAQPRNKRRDWAIEQGFSASVLHEAMSIKNELVDEEEFAELGVDKADKQFNIADEAFALEIQKSIASGLVDRLLVRHGDNYRLQQGGGNITPDRSSIVALRAAPLAVSGSIFGEPPRAVLNQPVEQEWLDEVAPYLKTLRSVEEEAERERKAAVAKAEAIMREHRLPTQESRAPLETTVSPVAEKKLSFIAKIKKAIVSFFDRIKKFLGFK